jgi:hypothetical protein
MLGELISDRELSDPVTIRVVFVGPDGTKEVGPSFTLPPISEPTAAPDDREWDKAKCLSSFPNLLRGTGDLKACLRAMDRLDCWKDCISQLSYGARPDLALGKSLLLFWETYGLYSIPDGLKDNLPVFVDALRRHLPAYGGAGITLYRGELESRHIAGIHGIAWTSKPKIASQFADRRPDLEGKGVVLRIEASSKMIVADHTMLVGARAEAECEYIVDPRMIRAVSVVPRYEIPGADDIW